MSEIRELVLGGEGLIGSTLVQELTRRGHRVASLDLKNGCDLRHVDDEPFRQSDRVWFLAWDTGGARYIEAVDRQHEQYKHNCELTVRVLDALARTRRPFLFISFSACRPANCLRHYQTHGSDMVTATRRKGSASLEHLWLGAS